MSVKPHVIVNNMKYINKKTVIIIFSIIMLASAIGTFVYFKKKSLKIEPKKINEQTAVISNETAKGINKAERQKMMAIPVNKEICDGKIGAEKTACNIIYQEHVASLNNDAIACLDIDDFVGRINCQYQSFRSLKDYEMCKRIPLKSAAGKCEEDIAMSINDRKFCEKIEDDPEEKLECNDRITAISMSYQTFDPKKDKDPILACQNLKTLEYEYLCEINAVKIGSAGCSALTDQGKKQTCIDRSKYSSAKKLSDCDTIADARFKGVCQSIFKNSGNKDYKFDDDSDGLKNDVELWINTDPFKADSDNDGLSDFDEYNKYRTNPTNPDTDEDGVTDGEEIKKNSDPKSSEVTKKIVEDAKLWWLSYAPKGDNDQSWKKDSDSDGLIDIDEVFYGTDPFDPDSNDNKINDGEEIEKSNNPTGQGRSDFDQDGLSDEEEIKYRTSRTNTDTDFDGLSDYVEIKKYGTDPLKPDTDGDGFKDGDEIKRGFDPKGEGKLK